MNTSILENAPQSKSSSPVSPNFEAIKTRQQAMWASGNFAVIGSTLQPVGEALCEAAQLEAGERVLDVACGNGNASLAAARCFCEVTGVDYVPALLEGARKRAEASGLAAQFVPGDAEALPFADHSFDAVLSTFGVMFAPDQERAAQQLVRVCVPGGRIALASWTPEGLIGDLLRIVTKYVPPPAGLKSNLRWGTEAGIRELFGNKAQIRNATKRNFTFRYLSAEHFIDVLQRTYGPTHKAFGSLDADGQRAMSEDLRTMLTARNEGRKAFTGPSEYLEVVLTVA